MFERNEMPEEMSKLLAMFDDDLTARNPGGEAMLAVGLLAAVYFAEPWRREVREIVAQFAEDYITRWASELCWALNPQSLSMDPFVAAEGVKPTTFSSLADEDDAFSIAASGASDPYGASAVHIGAFAPALVRRDELGFIRFGCPLVPSARSRFHLPDVLLELCKKLRPVSGYAGMGMFTSLDSASSQRWEGPLYELAQRFPGLEMEYSISHSIYLAEGRDGKGGIKGVNWLTAISDVWLDELGGAAAVAADLRDLDPRYILHRYDGGLLIQAGDRPALGDTERDAWPDLYVKLARYLKPIRITRHSAFGSGGRGWAFGPQEVRAWLARFDDR
ncbi:type VI immunity family protein [Chondromyces crocatus]|uniref:DUF3396 domain-containing protein n=1 Tax=Chondromyces crocatus TaxID=52 RepID=A0A0K1EAH5_CHOCO|nr:type VI immunity family protein [Chondromyces crocatus]AKT37886.1 uncharacterized protein CMC5_020290 [Chondromyces crocatus]